MSPPFRKLQIHQSGRDARGSLACRCNLIASNVANFAMVVCTLGLLVRQGRRTLFGEFDRSLACTINVVKSTAELLALIQCFPLISKEPPLLQSSTSSTTSGHIPTPKDESELGSCALQKLTNCKQLMLT